MVRIEGGIFSSPNPLLSLLDSVNFCLRSMQAPFLLLSPLLISIALVGAVVFSHISFADPWILSSSCFETIFRILLVKIVIEAFLSCLKNTFLCLRKFIDFSVVLILLPLHIVLLLLLHIVIGVKA